MRDYYTSSKVCAVVVAYNRKDLLRVCLRALENQTRKLDNILVVDNASNDGTQEMITSEFPVIEVIRLSHNTGGAGGFAAGVRIAFDDGYDMFWLMDDDAEPYPDALEILLSNEDTFHEDVVCIAGKVLDRDDNIALAHRGHFNDVDTIVVKQIQKAVPRIWYERDTNEIDAVSFVGPLIKRDAVRKIGFPMHEFFIHQDDMEYSVRLRKIGKIKLISKSSIKHYEASTQSDDKTSDYNKLWIRYYAKRNIYFIANREFKSYFKFICSLLKALKNEIRLSISVILHSDNKVKRVVLPYLAIYNGLRKNFDNTVPRRWLYGKK